MKFIMLALLVSMVSFAMAQRTFKTSDVINGKTIATLAKEWDLKAFQQTKEIYKPGMSKDAFIKIIRSNFPTEAPKSLVEVFVPYYEYIYNFHASKLTEKQILSSISGVETADMITQLSVWDNQNPGVLIEGAKWPWRKILQFIGEIIPIIIAIFF